LWAERFRALEELRGLRSKKKLWAEKRRETHFLSNEEREKWIEECVERETAVASTRVKDAEAAVQQVQEHMKHVEIAGLTNRDPEKTFDQMMAAIVDTQRDLACSDVREDGEDEDAEETEQGKLSEDDKPGWVMRTITKTVQQSMERFRQKQMKLDKLSQPRYEDAPNYFPERDNKYFTSQLIVPAVIQLQSDNDVSPSAPTTFGEFMEYLEIVPRILSMLQGTSRAGGSQMRIGSMKP